METTRHFTATVYVVNDGAVALHEHEGLDKWLPPGGHVDRDELPHEAGRREVEEETGLEVDLIASAEGPSSGTVRPLPEPRHLQLADVNVHDGEVGHQHVDFVYYAEAGSRAIDPAPGEAPPGSWRWFDGDDLRDGRDRLEPDVVEIGLDAIGAVRRRG